MEIIDSAGKIILLIDLIQQIHEVDRKTSSAPSLYVNFEGIDVHRNGFISLVTLLLDTGAPTPLLIHLDMFKLGTEAFNTTGTEGKSFKNILQDKEITRVFFDVCDESDALFAQYGVALQDVHDIQLLASATKLSDYLENLQECVKNHMPSWDSADRAKSWRDWRQKMEAGERLCQTQQSGAPRIFLSRPIPKAILEYSAVKLEFLPDLHRNLWPGRDPAWQGSVKEKMRECIEATQKPEYRPDRSKPKRSPWNNDEIRQLQKGKFWS